MGSNYEYKGLFGRTYDSIIAGLTGGAILLNSVAYAGSGVSNEEKKPVVEAVAVEEVETQAEPVTPVPDLVDVNYNFGVSFETGKSPAVLVSRKTDNSVSSGFLRGGEFGEDYDKSLEGGLDYRVIRELADPQFQGFSLSKFRFRILGNQHYDDREMKGLLSANLAIENPNNAFLMGVNHSKDLVDRLMREGSTTVDTSLRADSLGLNLGYIFLFGKEKDYIGSVRAGFDSKKIKLSEVIRNNGNVLGEIDDEISNNRFFLNLETILSNNARVFLDLSNEYGKGMESSTSVDVGGSYSTNNGEGTYIGGVLRSIVEAGKSRGEGVTIIFGTGDALSPANHTFFDSARRYLESMGPTSKWFCDVNDPLDIYNLILDSELRKGCYVILDAKSEESMKVSLVGITGVHDSRNFGALTVDGETYILSAGLLRKR